MNPRRSLRIFALVAVFTAAGLSPDFSMPPWFLTMPGVPEADARVGRPATPGSVAGVARRTTRRRIRRSTIYVASLPKGCTTVSIEGTTVHQCGTSYYQPSGGQYVVVYVD
jgi:hypothetical protein